MAMYLQYILDTQHDSGVHGVRIPRTGNWHDQKCPALVQALPGGLGSPAALGVRGYGILCLPLRIKKRPICSLSFFSVSPFFNKFPSYVHSEKLCDYSRMICLNVRDIRVKSLLKRERQKEMMGWWHWQMPQRPGPVWVTLWEGKIKGVAASPIPLQFSWMNYKCFHPVGPVWKVFASPNARYCFALNCLKAKLGICSPLAERQARLS